jgi:putative NADPH-quinone reductase
MNALVIIGHPRRESLSDALGQAYLEGWLSAGGQGRMLRLSELSFDGSADPRDFETEPEGPDILQSRELIKEADHIVVAAPVWWGVYPPLLHGFICRVFSTGFAFKYNDDGTWQRLLKGRTGRLIMTSDAPAIFQQAWYLDPGGRALKWAAFWFCGIWPVRITRFGKVRKSAPEERAAWLAKVQEQARRDARRSRP